MTANITDNHADVLIIGAGIFGTSTAFHLCKGERRKVTVIDRTSFPPKHAASTDINKIVRADYSSPFYMDLAFEAMQAWAEWPELSKYYHRTGWVNFSERGSDLTKRIRDNFEDRGHDPTSDLSFEDVRREFGGIYQYSNLDAYDGAYWNPEAGWCNADSATAELMQAAVNSGVRYVSKDIERLILSERGVKGVIAKDGELLTGDKIVLATGAWTSSILSPIEDELDIAEKDRFENQARAAGVCVAHYKILTTELQLLKDMPVTIYGEHGDAQPPPNNNLLKFTNGFSFTNTVTTSSGHRVSVPLDRDQTDVPERLKQETWREVTSKLLPQFTSRPVEYWRLCWDAVTPSQDHLISRHPHPSLGNLFLAVGGSFHSYKYLPNIGFYVMNVVDGHSNGKEKDQHWNWKSSVFIGQGAHEKAYPTRELRDVELRSSSKATKL